MSKYDDLKRVKEILVCLHSCDFIVVNGSSNLVGLKYRQNIWHAPQISCKYSGEYTYFIARVMSESEIPCIEDKILAMGLDQLREGTFIPEEYYRVIANYFHKFKVLVLEDGHLSEQERFTLELNRDIQGQLYNITKDFYKKSLKMSFCDCKNRIQNIDLIQIEEELKKIAKEKSYELSINRNSVVYDVEYELRFNYELVHFIFVSEDRKEIVIGNENYITESDLTQETYALNKLNYIIKDEQKNLLKQIKKCCENLQIYKTQLEIARSGINTLLEDFEKRTGCNLVCNDSDKTAVEIFREKISDDYNAPKKMYRICITYNEFLKDPAAFKQIIENPKGRNRWNFLCREMKYNPEIFQNKRL